MRRLIHLTATAIVALGIAVPAAAATGPQISELTQVRTNAPYLAAPCPGGFFVRFSATIHRRDIRFADDEGRTVLERRHVDFQGTLSNSLSGKTLPYRGHFTRVHDLTEGTVTVTGLSRHTVVPGSGLLALDAGRAVLDAAANELLFEAGQHEYDAIICELLA